MKRWLTQIEPNLLDYVNVNKLSRKDKPSKPLRNKLSAEYIILFLGLLGLLIFVWMMIFFFVPFLRQRPQPLSSSPPVMVATSTPDFILPPTWTPEPTEVIIPTLGGTQVVSGEAPTRVYTPRATSLSGIPRPDLSRPSSIEIIDLARILQGESAGDKQAAYMVGWVAKNRLFHVGYGDTYAEVSGGFFGYLAGVQPSRRVSRPCPSHHQSKRRPDQRGPLCAITDGHHKIRHPGRSGRYCFWRVVLLQHLALRGTITKRYWNLETLKLSNLIRISLFVERVKIPVPVPVRWSVALS